MLILNICDAIPWVESRSRFSFFKRKREEESEIKRKRIYIEGKPYYFVNVFINQLETDEFNKLLLSFKGKILLQSNGYGIKEEYLYNPKPYYSRALISSLVKRLKNSELSERNVIIKLSDFFEFPEFYDLVKISKNVGFCFKNSFGFDKFIADCYRDYGAVVKKMNNCNCGDVYGFCLDLTQIDDDARAYLYDYDFRELLQPDMFYFKMNKNVKVLTDSGIDLKVASAVINS